MKIITKFVVAGNSNNFGKILFRNLLLNNNKNYNLCRLYSSKSDDVNQNNEKSDIKSNNKQPFLIIPINFFEQIQKLKLDNEAVTQAIKKLENLNQNNQTTALHLAAIIPTKLLSKNNPTKYFDENIKIFKNIEAPVYSKDHELNENKTDNAQLKEDPIQAFLINKNTEHMIPFKVNEDVRQQFSKLPVYELNLEYNIETPELEKFIEKYKNSNSKDSRKKLMQNVMPVKFDAEIKGAIKLEPEKLHSLLKDMDTTQFNSLLTSLAASICRNVIQKRIEYHNKEIKSELDQEYDSDRLSGGVKLNNAQNSSVYIQRPDLLPELNVHNLTTNQVKSNISVKYNEIMTDEELDSLKSKMNKHNDLNILANVGSVSGSPCGGNDKKDEKKDSPCGKKEEKKDSPCGKKEEKKDSPCGKKEEKKDSPCGKKEEKKESPCGSKKTKKSPCSGSDDKKDSTCAKKDEKTDPCAKKKEKEKEKSSSTCGKKEFKSVNPCAGRGKKDPNMTACEVGKKKTKPVEVSVEKPCPQNTIQEEENQKLPKACNVKEKPKPQACGEKVKNTCGAKPEKKEPPPPKKHKSSPKHKKSDSCYDPCGPEK